LLRLSHIARVCYLFWRTTQGLTLPGDTNGHMQFEPPEKDKILEYASTADGRYFKRNLQALIALTLEFGATPVVVTESFNPAYENPGEDYFKAAADGIKADNRYACEVAAERGIVCIDTYPYLRDPSIFADAVHHRPVGSQLKAKVVYEALMGLLHRPFPEIYKLLPDPAEAEKR
jgi:hypothetical protein